MGHARWRRGLVLIAVGAAAAWAAGCTNVVEASSADAEGGPDTHRGGVDFRVQTGQTGGGDTPRGADDVTPDAGADVADSGSPPPEDTAGPLELPPLEDVVDTADAGPPPDCKDGAACDDGDLCTYNDQCVGGVCGGTAIDCSDELPCTDDACQAGACVAPIADGFCLIDGICWNVGQANPTNACQVCESSQATKKWTGNDGHPCDDGDSCTWPDVCLDGGCSTTPASCPDDDDPCTLPKCVAGDCSLIPVLDGEPCESADPCVTGAVCAGGACSGGGPKDTDLDGFVDVACGGFDCDDDKGWVQPGVAEDCEDELDNDCDGQTDADDSDCGPFGAPCTHHDTCYPEGLCGLWATTGATICSQRCAGSSDCGDGIRCTKAPGSGQVGFCEPAPDGLAAAGATCTLDTDCESGLCEGHNCSDLCLDEAHCAGATQTCHAIGDPSIGWVTAGCAPNGAGLLPIGQACQFSGAECSSGHCDVMAPTQGSRVCSALCTTRADCLPGQECNIVYYADIPNPDTVPYHPLFEYATYDTVTACYTPPGGLGTKQDGAVCTLNTQCPSYKCLPLIPGEETRYCTRLCGQDDDCHNGMQCKLEVLNLTSAWLQAGAQIGAKPANLNGWTLVNVCKFP